MVKKILYLSLFVIVFILALQSVSASDMDLNDVNANSFDLDDSSDYLSSVSDDVIANGNDEEILNDDEGETLTNHDGELLNDNGEEATDNDDGNPSDSDSDDTEVNNRNVTTINVSPVTFDYSSEGKLNINLTDENGVGLANKTLFIKIKDSVSNLTTNEKGLAIFKYSNSVGNYTVNISFNGDEFYEPSSASTKITITKS